MRTKPPVTGLADSNVATLLEPKAESPDHTSADSAKNTPEGPPAPERDTRGINEALAASTTVLGPPIPTGPPPPYIPVPRWNDHYDWPPPGGLRHLIFHADSNGFAAAFKRVGRRVLVNPVKFWEIVDAQG